MECHQYTLNRRGRDGQTYWRCVDRSCLGRATTDENDQVIAENQRHDHPPESAQAAVAKVVDKMKQRAKNEATPVNTIYRETLQEISQPVTTRSLEESGPKRHVVKTSFWLARITFHIFATEGNLQLLHVAQSEELYVDGTFHIAPRLFYQVFTIHVLKHGRQFPWHTVYKGSREVLG